MGPLASGPKICNQKKELQYSLAIIENGHSNQFNRVLLDYALFCHSVHRSRAWLGVGMWQY